MKNVRGSATVEFVITFPLILMIALGIIQLALIYSGQQIVHYAAYCAARAGLTGTNQQQTAAIACIPITNESLGTNSYSLNGIDVGKRLDTSLQKITVVPFNYANDMGAIVDCHFELVVPLINKIFVFPNQFSLLPWADSPVAEPTTNQAITAQYGSPHILIQQAVTLPKPWQ